MSHVRRPQTSRFGLRCVRSTFVTSASNHTTSAAKSGSTGGSAGSVNGSEPGRKSIPRFRPGLAASSSWISGSGSAWPSSAGTSTTTSSGTSKPERARELAREDLGDERALALAGAA